MRWLLILILLAVAIAARADGFAYGKGLHSLRETDQTAVIGLDDERADVAMYIAIDGIPAEETISFVLPFWYAPEGFKLEEMDDREFTGRHVDPVRRKVERMNRIADEGVEQMLTATALFGLGTVIPMMVMPRSMGTKGRFENAATPAALTPYAVRETEHAHVELYRKVEARDLPQLVAQAGLPAKYAEPLQKYHTEHFAIMRLAGPTTQEEESGSNWGSGVCYTFHHRLPPAKREEYVYPLGTGAAWSHPILLTQVFVHCPDRFDLRVAAPDLGTRIDVDRITRRFLSDIGGYQDPYHSAEERRQLLERYDLTEEEMIAPRTASLLSVQAVRPSAWHIAYVNSNPADDIAVKLEPRAASWRLRVAEFLGGGATPLSLALVSSLFSWAVAAWVVIRPRWLRAGRPGYLLWHAAVSLVLASLWVSALLVLAALLAHTSYVLYDFFSRDQPEAPPILAAVSALLLVGAVLGVGLVTWRHAKRPRTYYDWRTGVTLRSWLLATAVYLVLMGGLTGLLLWCRSALTGV
jgi:hypothetical protein